MRVRPVSEKMIIGKLCPFRKIKVPVEWNESVTGQSVAEEFLVCYGDECMMWDGRGCSLCRTNMVVNHLTNEPAEQSQKQHREAETLQDGKTSGCKDQRQVETTVKVLEAKDTKNPGTVRAWCEIDGKHEAIFAKNGVGKVLLSSIGKNVAIKYCILEKENGSKGIFAVHAKAAE